MGIDPPEEPRGLVLEGAERPPRVSVVTVAAAVGSAWGLLCYSILWEGEPVGVQRAFVDSTLGLLALLPVRVVLWAIRLAEDVAGRTFELSANHWWIGVAAAVVGAVIVGVATFGGRALLRRLDRDPAPGTEGDDPQPPARTEPGTAISTSLGDDQPSL
jgi:hypothetical protein